MEGARQDLWLAGQWRAPAGEKLEERRRAGEPGNGSQRLGDQEKAHLLTSLVTAAAERAIWRLAVEKAHLLASLVMAAAERARRR